MLDVQSTTVLAELDAGVLTLTLNRPERNNAWNVEMESTLHDLLERASTDAAVRAIVLTAAGRTFCPGLDSDDLHRVSATGQALTDAPRRPITMPMLVPKPVICAINGGCAGIALVTALFCDVRFAARGAKLTTAFTRRALPAELGAAWILPRIAGHAVALDLILSGRVFTADEALGWGIVNQVVEPGELLSAAVAYARDVAANCSPMALALAKQQVYDDWEGSLERSRLRADAEVAATRKHPDRLEGVVSLVERRAPVFEALARPVVLPK